jgi:hypothetical protein
VGSVHGFSPAPETDRRLRAAIRERRLITFGLHGFTRRAEPHDYGIIDGTAKLFFYQVGGGSRSRKPVGWRLARVDELHDIQLLETTFAGPRETRSGRHVRWDRLIASVSRKVD